jgi:glycosyltransferase involved in cell wall biosynthesis
MKILLINSYHYRKGGADAVYFNTAKLLTQYGHEVFYFSAMNSENFKSQTDKYFAKGYDFRKLSLRKKLLSMPSFLYNKEAYLKLIQLLEDIKPDIAHVHLFMGGLSSSILLALRRNKVPIIHSVHDYRLICPAYLFVDGNNQVCEKCKDRFYLRCALNRCSEKIFNQSAILVLDAYFRKYFVKPINIIDCFIFVSKFNQNKHIEFNKKFQPKAEMLYNFNPDLNSIIPNNIKGSYFLYYGRLSREKGVQTLIESALNAKISLKIVGNGPLMEQYSVRYLDNIEFLGFKNGEELWNLVRNASFVIVPSEWYENNPLTIIEAYSYGKPVIGARIGGIPEIIEENKTGFLFEPGDVVELEKLLLKAKFLSSTEYEEMSVYARAFADIHFNPNIHYQELISVYENMILNKI